MSLVEAPPAPEPAARFPARARRPVLTLYAAIALATALTFATLFAVGRTSGLLVALGLLAYTLGLRHGVDADHICAIDATTRKLLRRGERPYTVGTWFSLGHATIVVVMLLAFVLAARSLLTLLPGFAAFGSVVGAAVSGGFLVLIALANLLILLEVLRLFRSVRSGASGAMELDELLARRGFMNRYFGSLLRLVDRPWQIYPVGLLFGLGFDTASEITLIAVTVTLGTASTGLPIAYVLLLPLLFACGMVLADTSDGVAMCFAYGWAFVKPVRKVFYNLTMTSLSVAIALAIGGLELAAAAASAFGPRGGPTGSGSALGWVLSGTGPGAVEVWSYLGLGIVAVFVGGWAIALFVYRWRRLEEVVPAAPASTPPLAP